MDTEAKKAELLQKERYTVDDLAEIVTLLRAPDGCPWDREQTHESIRGDLIEETYEVVEAIDKADPVLLREELGDLLLQVAMHTEMEREAGRFTLDDVADGICKKLIHRHPHVFGDVAVETSAQVLSNWEAIKSEEKQRNTVTDKLRAVPRQYPALMRAVKVGKKAAALDFPDAESVARKVEEELAEVREAMRGGDREATFEEVGDLLLAVASLARKLGVDAERSLGAAVDKFIDRFAAVEAAVTALGHKISEMSDEKLDILWQNLKKTDKKH